MATKPDVSMNQAPTTQEEKMKLMKQLMEKREQERKEQLVQVVMRQTDYDETKAREKLKKHKYDVAQTIREYMNPNPNPNSNSTYSDTTNKSTNQMIYGEFRKLLDDAATNYRIEKEKEEKRAQYIQMLQKKRDEAANSMKNNTK